MKPVASLTVALAAFTPLAAAWPSWLPAVDALVARQDSETTGGEASASQTPTATGTGSSRASTTRSSNGEETSAATTGRRATGDLNTAEVPTGSQTATRTRTTSIDDTAPQGGVVMVTPAPNSPGLNLYKIGTNVTFGWNYTNLVIKPTAIDVLASNSVANQIWTLTANMTWEEEGSYTWDTEAQATDLQAPLLTDQYTLVIHDADAEITDTAKPGYLGTASQFTFKLYKPQEYVPLSEWQCTTCSAAPPSLNSKGMPLIMSMSAATVLGFTWFVTGLSL